MAAKLSAQNPSAECSPNPHAESNAISPLSTLAQMPSVFVESYDETLECISDAESDIESGGETIEQCLVGESEPESLAKRRKLNGCEIAATCGNAVDSDFTKLKLVLDLDNTLLHAIAVSKCNHCQVDLHDFLDEQGDPEMFKFTLGGHPGFYYLKLRPGVRRFLKTVSKYYEMSVHTNATVEYADVIRSIIDHDEKYFGDRVAARKFPIAPNDQTPSSILKDIGRLYSSSLDDVVILDDRCDVWEPRLHNNIIRSDNYEYFDSRKEDVTRVYPPANSNFVPTEEELKKSLHDLVDFDSQLLHLEELLVAVHSDFNRELREGGNPRVADILRKKRSSILKGDEQVAIGLAGFNKSDIPTPGQGELDFGLRFKERLEELGARVVGNPSDMTHMLMLKNTVGSGRVWSERGKAVQYCHALWLYACSSTWKRLDESLFDAFDLLSVYGDQVHQYPHREVWRMIKLGEGKASPKSPSYERACQVKPSQMSSSGDAHQVSSPAQNSSFEGGAGAPPRQRVWGDVSLQRVCVALESSGSSQLRLQNAPHTAHDTPSHTPPHIPSRTPSLPKTQSPPVHRVRKHSERVSPYASNQGKVGSSHSLDPCNHLPHQNPKAAIREFKVANNRSDGSEVESCSETIKLVFCWRKSVNQTCLSDNLELDQFDLEEGMVVDDVTPLTQQESSGASIK
eukprot:GHVN01010245.1.p1 GENE.GHVN01010245.1~~GHVN01010245.1.p1  ORF type:complete len:683 (-),score=97.29 GHVN01010245.1:1014-3062(-)